MTDPVTITLLGPPVAYARSRYTPKKQRNTMAALRILAQQEMFERLPMEGPLQVVMLSEFPIPGSWSKKRQAAAIGQFVTTKPDLDNILKLAKDAFKAVVWRDDAQVARVGMDKIYGLQPKITITISRL
jgi:Holliday junction resolvase RusA-like endonuclease